MTTRFALGLLRALFWFQDLVWRSRRHRPAAPPPAPESDSAADESKGYLVVGDGVRLCYRCWLSNSVERPRWVIGCIHGIAAHGRHFRVVGERLSPIGAAVYAFDLRGHGLSEGERGDLSDMRRILADLADMVCFLAASHPGSPVLLWGESAGGPLVVKYAAESPQGLAGIILSCPQFRPTVGAGGGEMLWHLPLLLFRPRERAVDMTSRLYLCNREKADVERERADPLRHNRISARSLAAVYSVIAEANRLAPKIELPTLILQGGHDLVTDPGAAAEFHRRLGTLPSQKRLVIIPEAWHGLLHDPDTSKVLDAAAEWLEGLPGRDQPL